MHDVYTERLKKIARKPIGIACETREGSWVYLSLSAHCRTQQHPVSSPSRDNLKSERKAARVAAAGD